jgi:hypothetical protein
LAFIISNLVIHFINLPFEKPTNLQLQNSLEKYDTTLWKKIKQKSI